MDVSVCLRSVAVGAILTVSNAKHAKDFVALPSTASAAKASSATLTPVKYCSLPESSPTGAAAQAHEADAIACFLCPPPPPALTAARARELLSFRKDFRWPKHLRASLASHLPPSTPNLELN